MTGETCEKAQAVEGRLTGFLTGDPWHVASMVAGWTGGDLLRYRLAIDQRTVRLHSTGMTPGTILNGTVITTLPVAYRPLSAAVVPCTTDAAGTMPPHLTIHPDGTALVYGVAATATYLAVEGEYAIDV
jgi:hypothetical protein